MIDRLLEFMKLKNLSSAQLADNLGIQRSGISHFVSGRNKPSLEFVLKLLNHYSDLNPDWLLFGRGSIQRNESGNHIPVPQDSGLNSKEENYEGNFSPANVQMSFDDLFSGSPDDNSQAELQTENLDLKPDDHGIPEKIDYQGRNKDNSSEKKSPDVRTEKLIILKSDGTFNEYIPAR
jgi:transcriptional regulator with XRE-family HTH domain